MRILAVNEKGWFFGGVERYTNDICEGLAARGHRVALLSSEPRPPDRAAFDAPFEIAEQLELGGSPHAQREQVRSLLARFRPEVAYVQRPPEIPALDRALQALPVARYVHDHDLYCPRRHKYFPLSSRICHAPLGLQCVVRGCLITRRGPIAKLPGVTNIVRAAMRLRAARRIDRLVVGSPWVRDMLEVNGLERDRIRVIPPVPRGLERPPQASGEEPLVLCVGQVIRGKGVDLLLRALATVRQPYRAIVIGTGNHLEHCRTLAMRLGLGAKVTFPGWVPHEQLEPYRARARLIAVPSRWPEPFGMVGVEAMWASRPVVSFAVGGIPSWLADGVTGFAAPEADCDALSRALERLLGDPVLAAKMGAAGHRRASELFRFEPQVGATEALLAETIESRARAPISRGREL